MAIVKLVVAFLLSLGQFLSPYARMAFCGGIDSKFENWSADKAYTADYAVELTKDPDRDFRILNFADIQLSTKEVYDEFGEMAEATIKQCIEEVKPDLITLTGDNAWCDIGYIRIIKVIDSYGIPWAPVMGNHDGDNGDRVREAWDSYLLEDAENCLFKFGPKDMGYGNYIINIKENGKIIHTLFMVDTHTKSADTERSAINYGLTSDGDVGYDHLWANQIEWYKWAVKGIERLAGHTVESSVFFHIPVHEYREAMAVYCDITYDKDGNFVHAEPKEEYRDTVFGSNDEWVCSPEANNGFFTVCKELGSTKNMIAGHEHVNNLSAEYEGIRLSYALKCGPGCYWSKEKNGGSVLTVSSDGHATFSHHYVSLA